MEIDLRIYEMVFLQIYLRINIFINLFKRYFYLFLKIFSRNIFKYFFFDIKKSSDRRLLIAMTTVKKVLSIDKKFRKVGVTGDLHKIDTMISDQNLDYDMPTLCGSSTDNPNILINSIDEFKKNFYNKHPYLKNINMKNLLIAGGSVSSVIRNMNYDDSDIDFFVYGLTPKKATVRVKEWLLDILVRNNRCQKNKNNGKESEENGESEDDESEDRPKKFAGKKSTKKEFIIDEYKIIRNKNTIAIIIDSWPKIKIQLIFRLYHSISEILHGFDLGSSAVGFDGTNVYFTTLGKFCHEYSCNIVDTTRRSTTYERRLSKYFDRKFNIVLPKLNINNLRTEYFKYKQIEICEIPYFTFGYDKIVGNKIYVTEFFNKYQCQSDYEPDHEANMTVYYQSTKINIQNLIRGIDYFYHTTESIDENNVDIIDKPPRLNKGIIINYYDNIRTKLNNKKIDVNLIKQNFTVEEYTVIIENICNSEIDSKEYLDDLVDRQKKFAIKKLSKILNGNHQIVWLTENPGTQLTSSFNPIFEDEKKWYGKKYYLA